MDVTRTDHFFHLPPDKQNAILDAAFAIFSRNGYKKASVSDIASSAGISKAMVFYYFGCKKGMYLHLVDVCGGIVLDEIKKDIDLSVTDFFERIKQATEMKMSLLKKHPALLSFYQSVFRETDPEVAGGRQKLLDEAEAARAFFVLDGADVSKFKSDVNPALLLRFFTLASEGFASAFSYDASIADIDPFVEEFYQCLALMRNHFYREEHLA